MGIRLRPLCAVLFLFVLGATPAAADTTAGVAAYDKGDYETARKLLKPEAEKGDPVAQVKYGLIFAKGLGVPRDGAQAFPWFQKAADQGNAEAMYCVGVAYDFGDTGAKDPAKAAQWYRKSAEKGYAKAQYNLAVMLLYGDGVPVDIDQGAQWLRKSAEQSDDDAEGRLAYNYIKGGFGVEQNLLSARYWADRAAKHGNDKAKQMAQILADNFKHMEEDEHVPHTAGGDGSSLEQAIQLPDAKNEMDGVDSEYKVLHYFFPGYGRGSQALITGPDQRPYDVLTVEKNGQKRDVYFDISNFFGKME